jgi:hypothetical protein
LFLQPVLSKFICEEMDVKTKGSCPQGTALISGCRIPQKGNTAGNPSHNDICTAYLLLKTKNALFGASFAL